MRLLIAIVLVLVGSPVLGCGSRAELTGSPPSTFDAGSTREGATTAPEPSVAAADTNASATYEEGVTHGLKPVGQCAGDCLCFSARHCPAGCYVTENEGLDGSVSEPFCANGIVTCGAGWAVGVPEHNCGAGHPRYVDAGQDGAFCCER